MGVCPAAVRVRVRVRMKFKNATTACHGAGAVQRAVQTRRTVGESERLRCDAGLPCLSTWAAGRGSWLGVAVARASDPTIWGIPTMWKMETRALPPCPDGPSSEGLLALAAWTGQAN